MKNYAVLSDLHGNLQAAQAVAEDMKYNSIQGMILLGDLIDYGMQSNEMICFLQQKLNDKVICSLWGNHESAIMMSDFTGFSSKRGADCAKRTAGLLDGNARKYLDEELIHEGIFEFNLEAKKCLAVHGSLADPYWLPITPDTQNGYYDSYDIVFSGHSHKPHAFAKYYDCDNPGMRNKHAVLFLNPGSVGQPRNHNPNAQYMILDTETMSVNMRSVPYDVDQAMSLFTEDIDDFYCRRLKSGV